MCGSSVSIAQSITLCFVQEGCGTATQFSKVHYSAAVTSNFLVHVYNYSAVVPESHIILPSHWIAIGYYTLQLHCLYILFIHSTHILLLLKPNSHSPNSVNCIQTVTISYC